jgi:hypothetical protein
MTSTPKTDQPVHADAPAPTIQVKPWPYPIPLTPILDPEILYPVDALPSLLKKAIVTYQHYGQQPIALIASSALANISLACQSLANVARDRYLVSPVSLYFIQVASSGERKSNVDNVFSKSAREWESSIREKLAPKINTALTLHNAWQMEQDGLLTQIKRAMISGKNTDLLKENLYPTLYFEDATHEALAQHLANGWPSASLWSDEAGIIMSSHSMQSNPTRFVALLNRTWDGKPFTVHRKTSANFILQNRRLTLNLMMQPRILHQMTSMAKDISRQSGFLARCLMAYPTSAMGNRFYKEPPASLDCLTEYNKQLIQCLNQSQQLSHAGCIDLPILTMSAAAKRLWIQFFNSTEAGLSDKGQWSGIKDFASKAAENVSRLAALFHLFEGKIGEINALHTEQAIEIINWHLQEARRLLTTTSTTNMLTDATKLMNWMLDKGLRKTSAREIQRLSPLRDREQRDNAIGILMEHHMLRFSKEGSKTLLELNPHCY